MNKAGDVTFTTDPGILGAQVTWNVTRIERDARDGAFGKQISVPMSILAPLTREMAANIDWSKVEKMLGAHLQRPNESPLDIPILQVAVNLPDGRIMRIPIDGNHRICARRIAGYPDFKCYVVPPKLEGLYRVVTISGTITPPR